MKIKLEDCELISNEQYALLVDPEFIGQTMLVANDSYYMCWRSEGKLYKTFNKLESLFL